MLKINLLRNVYKINFKINFKISYILTLFWRISLKTKNLRIFYTLNKFIYDIHYIFFNNL